MKAKVTKQKDGPEGVVVPFDLMPVELGLDEDGNPRTSCVVEAGQRNDAGEDGPELSDVQRMVFDALRDVVEREGSEEPGKADGYPFVDHEVLRREAVKRGISSGGPEAAQKAFKRAKDVLVRKGYVGSGEAGRVWIIKSPND